MYEIKQKKKMYIGLKDKTRSFFFNNYLVFRYIFLVTYESNLNLFDVSEKMGENVLNTGLNNQISSQSQRNQQVFIALGLLSLSGLSLQ